MTPRSASDSHRVTVVVDTSLQGLYALEAAASLAARRKASLEALFVEDTALFQLAALPFARELDRSSGAVRPMNPSNLEGGLRAKLDRVRRAVDQAVAQRAIPASVRVARGHYVDVALAAAPSVDVLFLWSIRHVSYVRRGLLAPVGMDRQGAICVLFDASDAGGRALELGVDLSDTAHTPLCVVLMSDSGADYAALQSSAETMLTQAGSVSFDEAPSTDAAAVAAVITRTGCQLVLMPQLRARRAPPPATGLLETLDCPVVLVS